VITTVLSRNCCRSLSAMTLLPYLRVERRVAATS
jgi:hypothetical protein